MFFTGFLKQIRNILQCVFKVRYRKSENWMMETVYSELKVGNNNSAIVNS